jgi:putative ABC transport system permease protein
MRLWVAIKLAIRETRSSRRALSFCILSVAIGVAALTFVHSVTDSLRQGLVAEGRQIFGADFSISGHQALAGPVVDGLTASLVARGARSVETVNFNSMLTRTQPSTGEASGTRTTTMVRVRAIGNGYPFYGSITTTPSGQFETLGDAPTVIVDPALLRSLGIEPGATVKLGNLEAKVSASFVKEPGSPTATFSFAPLVFMHVKHVAQTGLLQTGSRVEYERLFALPPGVSAIALKDEYWDRANAAKLELQTYEESAANVQRFLERLSTFLTIIGLVVLLLGALGIGAALHALMKQKVSNAAILRCLGASPAGVFAVYGLLSLFIAAIGSVAGAAVGALIPLALDDVLHTFSNGLLPAHVELRPTADAVVRGIGAGLVATFAFTLLPLWGTATVSPLRVLRREAAETDETPTKRRLSKFLALLLTGGVSGLLVLLLALLETRSLSSALTFAVAVAGALGLLAATARLVTWGARLVAPRLSSYTVRQGVANLHRPGNQTLSTIVAVGLGVTLLSTVAVLQHSLTRALSIDEHSELPNLFLIDVLPEQLDGVKATLAKHNITQVDLQPMITGRLRAVNQKPIDVSQVERHAGRRTWQQRMRTREYFFSYRSQLIPSETLISGTFWNERPLTQEASIDDELAKNLNIGLGDSLTLDIQGLPVDAKVTSIRQIQWQAMRPNTLILLSPGPIEDAPKTFVGSVRAPNEAARYQVQTDLIDAFPNLSAVDITEAAGTAVSIMKRIAQMFSLVGLLSIAIGSVIVAGAIAAGRFARQREVMLLKVLGASPRQLSRILVAEYATLSVLAAAAGWCLTELATRTLMPLVFESQVFVPYPTLGLLLGATVALNVAVAAWVGRQVSSSTPLDILREQ